jgi:pimeloyl-ACP methyl ester carboxylesterase
MPAGRYRCISWDERGHGKTACDELAPFSCYDSADDLAAVLRHAGVERAALAGMSQGGYPAIFHTDDPAQALMALIRQTATVSGCPIPTNAAWPQSDP